VARRVNAFKVRIATAAVVDLERLQDFLDVAGDPASAELIDFIIDALDVLTHQPGIGRPVQGDQYCSRELIIDRGSSGYLAQYQLQRGLNQVTVVRIRHQRESGYLDIDI
jgi:plasmid stabilization system protein ParE